MLYNCSVSLWSHTDKDKFKQPGQYALHYRAYPIGRAEGQAALRPRPGVPDHDQGRRSSVPHSRQPVLGHAHRRARRARPAAQHPRRRRSGWTPSSIPRGGRVVFRSRFADYVGMWVNHCHILMHEDHGMMQAVESVARAKDANYRPRTRVASHAMPGDEVNAIYPPPSLELMYRQSLSFVDSSPELGQVFPGFPWTCHRWRERRQATAFIGAVNGRAALACARGSRSGAK